MKTTAGQPASEILRHWKSTTGLSETTARATHRNLTENNKIPRSRGGKAQARFDCKDAALLLLGTCIATEQPIRTVSELAPFYYSAPDEQGNKAGDEIATLLDGVRTGRGLSRLLNSRVEIDLSFPRVSISVEGDEEEVDEQVFCAVPDKASTFIQVRSVKIISGDVLYRLGKGLIGDWDQKRTLQ